jgi:hypothetical protein
LILNVIGNYVWNDVDRDGVQEAGEPGINGVASNFIFFNRNNSCNR